MNQNSFFVFSLRVVFAHTIAYFVAGILALHFLNYKEFYATDTMSLLMLPVDTPIVILGPALQVIRGFILALVLYPFRSVIFNKNGFLKLSLVVFGLSLISTIGPTPSSFDGVIYTVLPFKYHLLGLPEAIIYIALFVGILALCYKVNKRYLDIIFTVLTLLIVIMMIVGYVFVKQGGGI